MSRLPQADSSEGASIQGLKFSTSVLSDTMIMMIMIMMDSTPQVGMLSANELYLLARQARSQTIKPTCSYQQKLLPSLKFYQHEDNSHRHIPASTSLIMFQQRGVCNGWSAV